MATLTLSVVTPSYCKARFLRAAASSVLGQVAPEIVLDYHILDNLSDDGTAEVLQDLPARAVRITIAPDRGQADAINRGFASASGDWLAWLNADDLYEPGALAAVAAAARAHPEARWIVGAFRIINAAGRPVGALHRCYKNFLLRHYSYPLLLSENIIPQMSVFIRRDLFEEAGPLLTDDPLAFDYEYWLRLGALAPPLVLGEVLSVFRYHAASITARNVKAQFARELEYALQYAGPRRWPVWLHRLNYWKTVLLYDLVKRF
jgi:glycosyltransferase involved in cell wall biosynthesis